MFDIGTNNDGSYKYFDYNIDKNLIRLINITHYSNVDILIMKELHREINYEKIQKVMHTLKWSWLTSDDPITIVQIQDGALDQIVSIFKSVKNKLRKDPNYFKDPENIPLSTGSGGFTTSCLGENAYHIYFSICDWDTFTYYDDGETEDFYKNHCPEFYNAKKADERKIKIKNILDEETN